MLVLLYMEVEKYARVVEENVLCYNNIENRAGISPFMSNDIYCQNIKKG